MFLLIIQPNEENFSKCNSAHGVISVVHISHQPLHSETEASCTEDKKEKKHIQVDLFLKSPDGQKTGNEMEPIDLSVFEYCWNYSLKSAASSESPFLNTVHKTNDVLSICSPKQISTYTTATKQPMQTRNDSRAQSSFVLNTTSDQFSVTSVRRKTNFNSRQSDKISKCSAAYVKKHASHYTDIQTFPTRYT